MLARSAQLRDREAMNPLMLHQTCDLGPIMAVTASITPTQAGSDAQFRLEGRADAIVLPQPASPERTDNLWKTTCFEIFWQPIGGTAYREFNLSPSGRWAAYDFDSFREGMRDAPVSAVSISTARDRSGLTLNASIAAELPDPAQVALNAIVEHEGGSLQFWALAFGPGKPEFHSEACRQMIIERD
ncbi:DOMON-like domain-containing protein [Erythrobacter sp. MTPC3]|uniref:DOMON-like domain-containing protein n=1 Tax=Erythrobacter sp. MTPC3 TaxID=3056564 RepID=UPI0036F29E5F